MSKNLIPRIVLGVLLATAALIIADINRDRMAIAWSISEPSKQPSVIWEEAEPRDEGLDGKALESLRESLENKGTRSFLVVRGGRLVYEWYASEWHANRMHSAAAMAKAVVGSPVLLSVLTDGRIGLDDPAAEYLPEWETDSLRSRISVRQLASHVSGLDNVEFAAGHAGELQGWEAAYYDDPAGRFRLAIEHVPVLFDPGTRYAYSGVAYYALAYAVTRVLQGTEYGDLESLLRDRVLRPIGIPDDAWRISYGESYAVDGMVLFAIGSGARITPRAVARIGQLFLDDGQWEGRPILGDEVLRSLRRPYVLPPVDDAEALAPAPAGGWWYNVNDTWPSLPEDAYAGLGRGGQVILVIPSLDFLMVRMGEEMGGRNQGQELDADLFQPLMRAVIGSSSRQSVSSGGSASATRPVEAHR